MPDIIPNTSEDASQDPSPTQCGDGLKLPWCDQKGRSPWPQPKGPQLRTDCQDPLAGEPCPQWSSILPSPALCPGYCLGCLPAPPRGTCRLFLQLFTELSLRKCQLDPFFFLVLQTCAGKSAGSADGFRFSFSSVKRPPLFKCNDNKNNRSDSYNGWHAHSGQTLAIYYFMILTRTL